MRYGRVGTFWFHRAPQFVSWVRRRIRPFVLRYVVAAVVMSSFVTSLVVCHETVLNGATTYFFQEQLIELVQRLALHSVPELLPPKFLHDRCE